MAQTLLDFVRAIFCEPRHSRVAVGVVLAILVAESMSACRVPLMCQADNSDERDIAAITALHARDVTATLSGDPAELAELWSDDAVRLEEARVADIGKAAIRMADEHTRTVHRASKIVRYAPDVKEVTVAGEWAFEWGYFNVSVKDSASVDEKPFRAKFLRVLRKQSDGTWRFARVMWNTVE